MKKPLFYFFIGLVVIASYLAGKGKFNLSFLNQENATIAGGVYTCNRKQGYNIAPEFKRALSLRNQRLQEANSSPGGRKNLINWQNCVNIQYADLETLSGIGTEGLFKFDHDSRLNNLTIYVDNSYKEKDDLLTAILLQHELTHISHFLDKLTIGQNLSCVDDEAYAYMGQYYFLSTLNQEEISSLNARITYYEKGGYLASNSGGNTIAGLSNLIETANLSNQECSRKFNINTTDFAQCVFSTLESKMKLYITTNPAYIKQCGL